MLREGEIGRNTSSGGRHESTTFAGKTIPQKERVTQGAYDRPTRFFLGDNVQDVHDAWRARNGVPMAHRACNAHGGAAHVTVGHGSDLVITGPTRPASTTTGRS